MSQFITTRTKAFTAGGALGSNIRVTLSAGKLAAADASTVELGTTVEEAFADGDVIQVVLRSAQGTANFTASEAITAGNTFYAAASGKVASTGTVALGTALETTTADGDYMEGLRAGPVTASGSYATLTGTEELTNKTVTSPVIKTGLTASGSAANDFSASTGTFLTSSGAGTLSGTTKVANTKFLDLGWATIAAGLTGGKTAITSQTVFVTCADSSHVFVTLPAPVAGRKIVVCNNSAQTADVYPNASETINNTTHLTIATYKATTFISDGTNWIAAAGA